MERMAEQKEEYEEVLAMSREIIKEYAYYVYGEVRGGNLWGTGIDGDIEVYKGVFLDVLGAAMGVPSRENPMTEEEERAAVEVILAVTKGNRVFTNRMGMVYTVCTEIFEKVMEEVEPELGK